MYHRSGVDSKDPSFDSASAQTRDKQQGSRQGPGLNAPAAPDAFNQVHVSVDRACLVVIYGPELGKRAPLTKATFEIGRSSRSDLPIDQESISRHHARITYDQDRHYIEDLGSTNGTFVNDMNVKRQPLKDGDQVKLGRSILKYMSGDNIEADYHEEIYRLMTMDALTQTHNRRYFNEALEREYNRSIRYHRALSLLVFDIDHFKKINESFGHVAGDSVLRQLARVVKPRLREQDCLARVGGEEFAVLLPEVDAVGARIAADKVRAIVEAARFLLDENEFGCTVSVGIATLDPRVTSHQMLYEIAE
jgi:diguanylate cyclase (GGDEF)-like protein